MSNVNFVTLSLDASNKKEIKLAAIVVRYFKQGSGVRVKLLDFKSVQGETEKILSEHLVKVVKDHQLEDKVVGFCGNYCNTNFGVVKRKRENNIIALERIKIGKHINGIGWGAHIVHNTFQTAVDVLPFEIEALVKVYKYFNIYNVRVT